LLCLSVLEHLYPAEQLRKAVREVFRVLRPGAVAVIGFPVSNSLTRVLLRLAGVRESEVHPNTHTDIVNSFRKDGLRIEVLRRFPAFLPLGLGLYSLLQLRRV
jgi:predicted SAM-dependent methyltransferase